MKMTAVLGYAPLSATSQDLDAQLCALRTAGINVGRAFTIEELSGSGAGRLAVSACEDDP